MFIFECSISVMFWSDLKKNIIFIIFLIMLRVSWGLYFLFRLMFGLTVTRLSRKRLNRFMRFLHKWKAYVFLIGIKDKVYNYASLKMVLAWYWVLETRQIVAALMYIIMQLHGMLIYLDLVPFNALFRQIYILIYNMKYVTKILHLF